MNTRLPRIVGCLLMLLLLPVAPLCAQGYSVAVHCPAGMTGRLGCTFYDTDSVPHRHSYRIRGGEVAFQGTVKAPCLVELTHPSLSGPVAFFIENANIDITIDAARPTASHITGSRTNSQYRYALEECPQQDNSCLPALVEANAQEVFAPYMLYSRSSSLEPAEMQRLFELLSGDATHTYHYRQLARRMATLLSTTEGMHMPDFVFANDSKKMTHFDSVRCDTAYSVILFTATFSDRGRDIEAQLQRDFPSLHATVVNIDRHPKFWDAPYLQALAVDRIPYMILLDDHGNINTRDARIWELRRLLPAANNKEK